MGREIHNGRILFLENENSTSDYYPWPGGRGQFIVRGDISGATVSLQRLGPDRKPQDMGQNTTLTAEGVGNFECPPGPLRAFVNGGTPSALYVEAHEIPQAK